MSKQVKRKITVELPKAKELLKNRLSVFDRLGTKKQPKANTEQSESETKICRQWSQQGTCAYGKACKYANTHKLISPSKQRASKNPQEAIATKRSEEVNQRLHSSVVVRTGTVKTEPSQWTDNDLECADADALEKRRQQLQRELEAQMKMESKKPAGATIKKEVKKHKSPTSSSSSSGSSSGSSSSSDDSSTSSSSTSRESRSKLKCKLKNKRASSSSSESGHKKKTVVKVLKSSGHKHTVKSMKKSISSSSLKKKLVDKSVRKKSVSPIARSRKRSLTPPQKSRSSQSATHKLVRSPKSERKTSPLHGKDKLRHEKEREKERDKEKVQLVSKSDAKVQQRGRSRDRKILKSTRIDRTSESRSVKNVSRQRSSSARRNSHVRAEQKRKSSTERKASPAKSRTSGCGSGNRRDKTPSREEISRNRDDRKQAISSDRSNRRNDLKDRKHNDRDSDRDRDRRERERIDREQAREKEREEALARCQERQRERDRAAKREQEIARERSGRARSRGGLDKPDRDKPAPRLLPRPGERALALAQAAGNTEKLAALDRAHARELRGGSRDRHRDREDSTRETNVSGNNGSSGGPGYHHHHHQARRNTPPSPRSPPPMVVRDRDRERDRNRERDRAAYDVPGGVSMRMSYDDDVMEADPQVVAGRRHGYDSPFDRDRRREDCDRYMDRYDDRRIDTTDERSIHHWDRARSRDNRSRSGGRGMSQNISPRHMASIPDWREHSPMMLDSSRWTPPHGHYEADRDRDSIHDHRMWPERDIRDQHHRQPMGDRDRERDRNRDALCERDRDRVLPRGVGWEREWPQDRERIPISGEHDNLPVQQQHPYRCHDSPSIPKTQKSSSSVPNKEQGLKRPHRDDVDEPCSRTEEAKKRCSGTGAEVRDSLVDEDDLSEISDDADEILNREDELPEEPSTNEDKDDSRNTSKQQNQQSATNSNANSAASPVSQTLADNAAKVKQDQQNIIKSVDAKNSVSTDNIAKTTGEDGKNALINDNAKKSAFGSDNLKVAGDSTMKGNETDVTNKGIVTAVPEDDVMDSLDFEEISDEELEEETKVKGLSDVLGVDWASLVCESKPKTGDSNQNNGSDPENPDSSGENSSKRLWRYEEILLRVGVSVEMAGHEFASKILKDIDTYQRGIKKTDNTKNSDTTGDDIKVKVEENMKLEPPKIQASVILHPIASMQVASRQKAKAREELFSINNASNRYCRALSARRDLAIRRQLCDLPPYQDETPNLRPCPDMFQATLKLLEEKT